MKKLKFLTLLMVCFLSSNAFADDDDTVSGLIVGPASSTSWTMHVVLNNEVSYNAFQMDITLPTGFSVTSAVPSSTRLVQGGNVTIDGASTETPFVVRYETIDATTNKVRVVAYNLGNNAISGTTGNTILKLKLTSESAYADPTTISDAAFSNVIFVKTSDLAGVNLAEATASGALLGDVNYDKAVNTTDAVSIINYYLGKETTIDKKVADMNDDDDITTSDYVGVINTYLGK